MDTTVNTTVILQLITLITLVSGFFLWSIRLKNATIESARQQTETIKQQLELMRAESESVVAKQYAERVKLMQEEFARMREDNQNLNTRLTSVEETARAAIGMAKEMIEENAKRTRALINGVPYVDPDIQRMHEEGGGAYPIDDDEQSTPQDKAEQ